MNASSNHPMYPGIENSLINPEQNTRTGAVPERISYAEERHQLLNSIRILQLQNASLREENQETLLTNQTLSEKIEKSHLEHQVTKRELERRQGYIDTFKKIEAKWLSRVTQQESRIQALTQERDRLLEQVLQRDLDAVVEIESKRVVLEEGQKLANHQKAIESKSAWLERYQSRLTQYSKSVNQSKLKVREISNQVAHEIQNLSQFHPLKDCLKITEMELTHLELRLRKLPESSMERPELEGGLTQLAEQRNFILELIEASQAELQRRANSLLEMSMEDALHPIPPPSPAPKQAEMKAPEY